MTPPTQPDRHVALLALADRGRTMQWGPDVALALLDLAVAAG